MANFKEIAESLIKQGVVTEEEVKLIRISSKYNYETEYNNLSDDEFLAKYNFTLDELNKAKDFDNKNGRKEEEY